MNEPVAELADRDHHEEDEPDAEHHLDGLRALLGGRLGQQVKWSDHGGNLSQPAVVRCE